jgi:hypothetical protein
MWLRDTAPQGIPIAEVGPRGASENPGQLDATDPRGHLPHNGTGERSAAPHRGPVDLTGPHGAAPRLTGPRGGTVPNGSIASNGANLSNGAAVNGAPTNGVATNGVAMNGAGPTGGGPRGTGPRPTAPPGASPWAAAPRRSDPRGAPTPPIMPVRDGGHPGRLGPRDPRDQGRREPPANVHRDPQAGAHDDRRTPDRRDAAVRPDLDRLAATRHQSADRVADAYPARVDYRANRHETAYYGNARRGAVYGRRPGEVRGPADDGTPLVGRGSFRRVANDVPMKPPAPPAWVTIRAPAPQRPSNVRLAPPADPYGTDEIPPVPNLDDTSELAAIRDGEPSTAQGASLEGATGEVVAAADETRDRARRDDVTSEHPTNDRATANSATASGAPASNAQTSGAPAVRGTVYTSRSVTGAAAPTESTGGFRWFGRRSEAKRDA